MAADVLSFPVLCISERQKVVDLVRDQERLLTSNRYALKNKWFEGLLIVDANGHGYLVKGAELIRKKRRSLRDFVKDPFEPTPIEVHLILDEKSPFTVPLETVKGYAREFIEDSSAYGVNWDKVKATIDHSRSYSELWRVLRAVLGDSLDPLFRDVD